MSNNLNNGPNPSDDDSDADVIYVENERTEIQDFVASLTPDEIRSGAWFTRLLSRSLTAYTEKVDWQYFQEKYKGMPADGIVEQRIKMAARCAAIEGGLSAGAYTAAVAATIGSLGGASPATVPAAVVTVMVDVVYTTQLQIRLAYDLSVLYRVPIDASDPDDLWKLIRVAFTIKGGEVAREGVVKVVPVLMRPLIKRFYSKGVLAAGRALPVVGKVLLQRNVIKIGIPLVGVPLATLVNRYTTLVAGRHAQAIFRNEARIIELARDLSECSGHPRLLLWVAWLVMSADGRVTDNEALLFRHLVKLVAEDHQVVDEQLAQLVDLDPRKVWRRVESEEGDLSDLLDAAERVAGVNGEPNSRKRKLLTELETRCRSSARGQY